MCLGNCGRAVASGEDTFSRLIAVVDATFRSLLGRRADRDVEGINNGEVAGDDMEDVASGLVGDLKDDDREEVLLLCGNDNGDGACGVGNAMDFDKVKSCDGDDDCNEGFDSEATLVEPIDDGTLRGSPLLNRKSKSKSQAKQGNAPAIQKRGAVR